MGSNLNGQWLQFPMTTPQHQLNNKSNPTAPLKKTISRILKWVVFWTTSTWKWKLLILSVKICNPGCKMKHHSKKKKAKKKGEESWIISLQLFREKMMKRVKAQQCQNQKSRLSYKQKLRKWQLFVTRYWRKMLHIGMKTMFCLVKTHLRKVKAVQLMGVLNPRTNLLTKRLRLMKDLTSFSIRKIINTNEFSS